MEKILGRTKGRENDQWPDRHKGYRQNAIQAIHRIPHPPLHAFGNTFGHR
jgi:hypothetical protein